MAVDYNRQYIGARYVPIFFNNPDGSWDWAQGFQYEPLTIVKYGASTFTSKKLVPATVGAPNTATEYWALTGDYNGAIVDIQNNVSYIHKEYRMKMRKILFIGDSWCDSLSTEYVGWKNTLKQYMDKYGFEQGIDYDIMGRDGACFTNNGYIELAQSASNINYNEIYIIGGANDYYNQTGLATAITQFRNTFPTQYIKFLFLSTNNSLQLEFHNFGEAFRNMLAFNGGIDCDLAPMNWVHDSSLWLNKGHLKTGGYVYVGFDIFEYVMGGNILDMYRPVIDGVYYDSETAHINFTKQIPSEWFGTGGNFFTVSEAQWLEWAPHIWYTTNNSVTYVMFGWIGGGNMGNSPIMFSKSTNGNIYLFTISNVPNPVPQTLNVYISADIPLIWL